MKAVPVKKQGNDIKTDLETPLAEAKYKADNCSINDLFVFLIV